MPTKKPPAAKPPKQERIWDKFLTERDKQVFEQAGYGALAAWGKKPALLIIDVNYAFTGEKSLPILESIKKWRNSCGSEGWDAIPVLQKLISMCRSKGIPIIYTTGTRRPYPTATPSSTDWPSSDRPTRIVAFSSILRALL